MSTQRHAFVVMPFGTKPGPDGQPIDFNAVFERFIQPALVRAGLEAFRADQELRAGDIRTDMFQELMLADLVVADLTIDNPNVWYELGVRHALRSRGVVLISGGKVPTGFDLYTDRKLRYSLCDGVPDPERLEEDQQALARMLRSTMESWHGRSISPVYNLLPNLQEPDWKTLRIGSVCEHWKAHDRSGDQQGILKQPRLAILLSGHRMDTPERTTPHARFSGGHRAGGQRAHSGGPRCPQGRPGQPRLLPGGGGRRSDLSGGGPAARDPLPGDAPFR